MERTEAEIRALLAVLLQTTVEPTLTSTEIDYLVKQAKRRDSDNNNPEQRTEWTALTVYALNAEKVPVTRNGYYYKVTTAGTSGATEPTWPTTAAATVTDGSVVWTNTGGSVWTPTWSVNGSVALGWEMKAARVPTMVTFSSGTQKINRAELIANFLMLAETWRNRDSSDVALPSANARPNPGINNANDETWDLWGPTGGGHGWAIPGHSQWIDDP